MDRRCHYVPSEDGHCTTCGRLPAGENCPVAAVPLSVSEFGHFHLAMADLVTALMSTRIGRFLRFIPDLVERTVRDDRS